jgi:hypothetical protein
VAEKLIEREIIAYGPTTSISTILANIPIKPRSLKIYVDTGASEIPSGFDDGTGIITGTNFTGTIAYSTGVISLLLTVGIPDSTRSSFVSYTYFQTGVTELNKVQYSNEDFQTNVENIKEFLLANYPEEYNDYVNSSMGMALIDIIAYSGQNLAWYLNRKVTDLYFPTARTANSISKISRMLGYKPVGAYASQVTLSLGLKNGPYTFPVKIQKPFAFKGPNGLQFEYRNSIPIVYAPGELTKTFDVNEGQTVVENFIATGQTNQIFNLLKVPVGKYVEEGSVSIKVGGTAWTEYGIIPFSNTMAFETNILSFPPYIKFGDGVQGQVPVAGLGIEVSYVICNGFSGRIAANTISKPVSPLNVNFTEIAFTIAQPSTSIGGDNPEDLRSITTNAPLFQKSQDRALTKGDYDYLSSAYPNVAMADAQIIRSIANDTTVQAFLSEMNTHVLNLKSADRYLHPQPQISKLIFSENLFDQNVIQFLFDATTVTQPYIDSNDATLNALVSQLTALSKVETAIIRSEQGNAIVVTGKTDQSFAFSSLSVTGGTVATITVSQITPSPNQLQRLSFDRDLFYGNIVNLDYDAVPVVVPFVTDSVTTLNALADAIRAFAKAPVGAFKETGTSPNQAIEIKFDKEFFNGNLIQVKLTDLSLETPVETLVEVSFRTSNVLTYTDFATAFAQLSFISSAIADAANKKITILTDAAIPQDISGEIIAFGDGTRTIFSGLTAVNSPIKENTFKVTCGSIIGVDNGGGSIIGTGITAGTINYVTGVFSITYTAAPQLGNPVNLDYIYKSSSRTIEVNSINVTTNTVTVDETARTIDVATDSTGSLVIGNALVAPKAIPVLTQASVQPMIDTDLGSVSTIATSINSSLVGLETYLDDAMSDGCKANVVQVSVLGQDAARKYAAPTTGLLDSLRTYLDSRKDIVHKVVTVSGYDKVINVDMTVEVLVGANSVQDEVTNKIERALTRSDSVPYGLLVERDFNKSLYISEIYDAIQVYLEDRERDYLNIVITGPKVHSTGFVLDEQIGVGVTGAFQLVAATLTRLPIVEGQVVISVDGVPIGVDNSEGSLETLMGSLIAVDGVIDYVTGATSMTLTPAPTTGQLVTATYYQSKLDKRGNYICPTGYVLQAGTVKISALPRS